MLTVCVQAGFCQIRSHMCHTAIHNMLLETLMDFTLASNPNIVLHIASLLLILEMYI